MRLIAWFGLEQKVESPAERIVQHIDHEEHPVGPLHFGLGAADSFGLHFVAGGCAKSAALRCSASP